MGAPGYLVPLLRALAARGARATLLDAPGFGTSRPLACAPSVAGLGRVTAAYLGRSTTGPDGGGPVVLLGHSTGAQGALRAALHLHDRHRGAAGTRGPLARLVLAGPTVAPDQRSLRRLLLRVPTAFRRDSVRELVVVPDYLRGHRRALKLIRSAVRDRPEEGLARLPLPVTVTAGRYDTFAPRAWLETLAASAVRSGDVRVAVLDGSHNNPFTHPEALADLALADLAPADVLAPSA